MGPQKGASEGTLKAQVRVKEGFPQGAMLVDEERVTLHKRTKRKEIEA